MSSISFDHDYRNHDGRTSLAHVGRTLPHAPSGQRTGTQVPPGKTNGKKSTARSSWPSILLTSFALLTNTLPAPSSQSLLVGQRLAGPFMPPLDTIRQMKALPAPVVTQPPPTWEAAREMAPARPHHPIPRESSDRLCGQRRRRRAWRCLIPQAAALMDDFLFFVHRWLLRRR